MAGKYAVLEPRAVFRDGSSRVRLEEWYDRFLAQVPGPVEHRAVRTAYGASHVLVAGDPTRPPLVALHGSLSNSALVMRELGPLLDRFQVFAPDIPGQSVRGPEVRLNIRSDAYAAWLGEVLDGLELDRVALLGVSWGGFVAMQTARVAPRRVSRLVLIVPAGIVTGPIWPAIRDVAIPAIRYRLSPTDGNLRRFVRPQATTWDEDWVRYLGEAMRGFVLDPKPPPLGREDSMRHFPSPTLVFGASDDVYFPGRELVARAKALIPHAETELLSNCRHAPPMTDEFRRWLAARITAFALGR